MADNSGHRLVPRGEEEGDAFVPEIINASTLMEIMYTRIGREVQLNVTVLVKDEK